MLFFIFALVRAGVPSNDPRQDPIRHHKSMLFKQYALYACECLWCPVTHCVNWGRINFNHKLHNLWNIEHFLLIYCLEVFGFCGFKFIIISMFGNKLISWHILTATMNQKKKTHSNDANQRKKKSQHKKKEQNESKLKFVVTARNKKSALLMYPYNIHLRRMCSIPFFHISSSYFLFVQKASKPLKRLMRCTRDEYQPSFK